MALFKNQFIQMSNKFTAFGFFRSAEPGDLNFWAGDFFADFELLHIMLLKF